ncbi:MAG: patatin-like phospholipase family protein [Gammaproteobacteria bacterium]|nr:patatin-like phospholipase family protein [Gammaproteobacteria bacterium]
MRISLLLIALLFFCHSFAERQSIGLALSGGGARGAAHIGVLRVIEEKNIPIDYIAGTSMGAIVGALYASGYTLDEIEEIVNTIDWQAAFEDDVKRDQRSYRRKVDDRRFISKLQIGLDREGLKLPAGIVSGQSIGLILNRYFAPVSHINHFDKLNIPFRAVATDLATGNPVIIEKGSLAQAVTASMSIPGFLIPVERNGQLLVDGGIANNLPISIVRNMGADIIIAVDISTPLFETEDLKDVVDVADQLSSLLTRKNTEREIETLLESDIIIIPELNDISTSDFNLAAQAIPRGETAARSSEKLASLASKIKDLGYRDTVIIDGVRDVNSITFDDSSISEKNLKKIWLKLNNKRISKVSFDNTSGVSNDRIRNLVDIKPGDRFSLNAIERNVNILYGMGYFNLVQYSLTNTRNGVEVVFHITEKAWGPNYLQIGFNFSSSEDIDNQFNLSLNYLMTNINELNGELSTGVSVGTNKDLNVSWYQPLDSRWQPFIETQLKLSSEQFNFFNKNQLIAEFSLDAIAFDIALGTELENWGEFRVGARYLDGSIEQKIGAPIIIEENYHDAFRYFSFEVDTLDSIYFPQDGILLQYKYIESDPGFGSQFDYRQNQFSIIKTIDWSENSVTFGANYFRSKGPNVPINALYRSGGPLNFSGYEFDQISSRNAANAYLAYMRKLELFEFLEFYLGVSYERGQTWNTGERFDWTKTIEGYSLIFGTDTKLGPFYVAYGNNEINNSFYIMLDKLF